MTDDLHDIMSVCNNAGRVVALKGFEKDEDPSPIGQGIVDVLDGPTRIKSPMVRRGWLEHGPGNAGPMNLLRFHGPRQSSWS